MRHPDVIEFVTGWLGLSLSPTQAALLHVIYGLPLDAEQRDVVRACTGRTDLPREAFAEVAVIAGARAGKDSRIAAPIVCYEAVFGAHEAQLGRGERGVLTLVAQDLRGTRVAYGYVRDYLTESRELSRMLAEPPLNSEVRLTNGLSIACFSWTLRSMRGFSIPVGVLDELAFFRLEGQADADTEIQASIRRGMLSFAAPRLVKISTPYMKSGVLYDDFRRYWAQDSPDVLVWRASSVLMNPTLRAERLERERRVDPDRFAREYEADFADDLDAHLPGAWVEGAARPGRHELPPRPDTTYAGAVDTMGAGTGPNADRFTLALVHPEGERDAQRIVQDVMKGWGGSRSQTVDLEGVVPEIASICQRYGVSTVIGDRYAAGWVRQAFERAGLRYDEAEQDKSAVYLEVEPLFVQGRIEILDHPVLVRELKCLERRPRPGGRTVVDHPRGGHDDHSNALALAAVAALEGAGPAGLPFGIGEGVSYWRSADGPSAWHR